MNRKSLLAISVIAILVLSACGSAEPAQNAEDISNTAVAEAWIAITQTQAAMPASVPTSTPQPTATLAPTLALPTLVPATVAVVATPTPECNQIPTTETKGTLVNIEFKNESEGQVNLAFGMNTPNDKGECFTYSYGIGRGDIYPARILAGCYWGYAWITGDEPSVARTGGGVLCLTDPNLIYHITITKESFRLN
ncbi:MAG: hypothetical protein Q8L87_06350 [Anaerolineales bacterium]|nr:hypothetical protein [Anaerolineales bacterium]